MEDDADRVRKAEREVIIVLTVVEVKFDAIKYTMHGNGSQKGRTYSNGRHPVAGILGLAVLALIGLPVVSLDTQPNNSSASLKTVEQI